MTKKGDACDERTDQKYEFALDSLTVESTVTDHVRFCTERWALAGRASGAKVLCPIFSGAGIQAFNDIGIYMGYVVDHLNSCMR